MQKRISMLAALMFFAIFTLVAGIRAEDDATAAAAIAKMNKKVAEVETLEMDIILTGASLPAGATSSYLGEPKHKTFRINMSMKDKKQNYQSLTVCDGETVWTEVPSGSGFNIVTKQSLKDLPKDTNPDPVSDFAELSQNYDFLSIGEEEFQGEKVDVVKAKFKKGKKNEALDVDLVKIFLRKDDSFPRKIDHLNAEGVCLISLELRSVKINNGLPQNSFKYVPPANAKVVDLKEMPNFGK